MARTPSQMLELGTKLPEFSLKDPDGNTVRSEGLLKSKGVLVAFICNHCPFVVHIKDAFTKVANECVDRGLAVVAINSNDVENYPDDSPENMMKLAKELGFKFPFLYDETQDVAKQFKAACTPDFYLFDANGALFYRGQMDGSRPGNDVPPTGDDLLSAAEAVLSGAEPPATQNASLGCNIKWRKGHEPSYYG